MASIDIRAEQDQEITEIVFADQKDRDDVSQAHLICDHSGCITIDDGAESVFINSKQHALDLIKALEKAIELGWVK